MPGRIRPVPLTYKDKTYTPNTYRRAKSGLLRCYKERCGYSAIHMHFLGGIRCLEVDHFNPATKKLKKQKYKHYVLASRHCNGSKSDSWPTADQRAKGLRLLNPRVEQDYGVHFVVDKLTGRLIGKTPSGIFHIRVCDLNADTLCNLRMTSLKLKDFLKEPKIFEDGGIHEILSMVPTLEQYSLIFDPSTYNQSK